MTEPAVPQPVFPSGRYGRRRDRATGRRRWLMPMLSIAAVLVLTGGAYGVYALESSWKLTYQVLSFGAITDRGVTITFQVSRPAGTAAVCLLRARARTGAEVGSAKVPVPAGPESVRSVSYRLATTTTPITGEVEACRPVR